MTHGGDGAGSVAAGPGLVDDEMAGTPPGDPADERLQLSDVAKLARRAQRRIVGVAREEDRVTCRRLIREHLGTDAALDVVEEAWPSYEHVNVQVGLDAWLAAPG